MSSRDEAGFSLIELMLVTIIFGMLIAMSIPTFRGYRSAQDLKTATENVAGQLRLAREKAMSTDSTQTLHFEYNYLGASDYHVHNGSVVGPMWRLPKGITYYTAGTTTEFRMMSNGRCKDSGLIVLQDQRGNRDTVSVMQSGLILMK